MSAKRYKKRSEKSLKLRQEAMNTLNLAGVISFLQDYLDNKYVLPINKKHVARQKKQCKTIKPKPSTDALPEAIALISERIVKKYCKGQLPHFERLRIWDICLQLLDDLTEQGLLSPGCEGSYIRNGYVFRCRPYHSQLAGEIIIPLEPPQIYKGQPNIFSLNFKSDISMDKSAARKIILRYAASRKISPHKWHFVYILQCRDRTFYTGCCQDLLYAMVQHRRKEIVPYTKSRLPVRLVYWEPYPSQEEALSRQLQIRAYSRARKEKLIATAINFAGHPVAPPKH